MTELGRGLRRLLAERGVPGEVSRCREVFGGNARRAWSFDLVAGDRVTGLIALVRRTAGQLDTDLRAEYDVLGRLSDTAVPAPRPVAIDPDGRFVGAPAVVVERLPGSGDLGAFLRLPADQARGILEQLARHTAALHQLPVSSADRLATARAVVAHWADELHSVAAPPIPALESMFGWLAEHVPTPDRLALVHGDLRPGNFLHEDGVLTGILDWELAHVGDPVEDLGWIYGARWSPARFLPLDDFVAHYARASGRHVSSETVRYYRVFAEARFAVISLKAVTLFAGGRSTNLRHAGRARELALAIDEGRRLLAQDART
jgi:aminoglycoside phosphotransferase (APT) family kinase protein